MNQQAAKREACWRAASVVRDAMAQGWPGDDLYPDDRDRARVTSALNELTAELERRGHA